MSRALHFDGPVAFQRFLRDQATRAPHWRGLKAQRDLNSDGFILEWPDDIEVRESPGCTAKPWTAFVRADSDAERPFELGETWKRARPIRRDERAQMAPICYLLVVHGDLEATARQVIDQAPVNLEFVTLAIEESKSKEAYGFLLLGEAGRMVAHSPPIGCTGYECDPLPSGGLAAFPVGWTAPPLSEHLWPQVRDCVILYTADATNYTAETVTISRRLPLAQLLTCSAKPEPVLSDAKERIKRTPWRVVRREAPHSEDVDGPEEHGTTSVVYRLRTFDRGSSAAGDLQSARGHELGSAFLQILDECEAGLLPDVQYSGFDAGRYERWHFLCVKDAGPRLLDAWNMVERFDHIKELERHGITAYLSRRSAMLPPVKALLGGGSEEHGIAERIRVMLGNPGKDTLVLIEDLEGESGTAAALKEGIPSNPRIIHIDRSRTIALTKFLPDLVRDWHNAEPITALGTSTSLESVTPLREHLERNLGAIGADENTELLAAAEAARASLAAWATDAARALEMASSPVAEAQQLCEVLTQTLTSGAASIDEASTALQRYCQQLTHPRRSWIADQHRQTSGALEQSMPRIGEANSARQEAERCANLLTERTETLRTAAAALREAEQRLGILQGSADDALTRARQTCTEVEARARIATDRVIERRRAAEERLGVARQAQQQLIAEQEALRTEQAAVRQLEQGNTRLRQANEQLAAELVRQRQRANEEALELARYRDEEIPALRRQTDDAERELAALAPSTIRAQLREAQSDLEAVRRQITDAKQELVRIESANRETGQAQAALQEQRHEIEQAMKALATSQSGADSAEQALQAKRDELERAVKSGGSKENCERRLKHANQALKEIEEMKVAKDNSLWSRLFGGGS
jgi:hypothetical protein